MKINQQSVNFVPSSAKKSAINEDFASCDISRNALSLLFRAIHCDTGLCGSLKGHVKVATQVYGLKYIVRKIKQQVQYYFKVSLICFPFPARFLRLLTSTEK